ncbi:MAG: hypothetical protein VX974_00965 [Pseudomonadota bacterium]|nr:hypothetical protein [Pseudomonadota bacterium]
MDFLADIILGAGALGAGFYCFILARRVRSLNDLENGVGGAVAALSKQVEDLNTTLVAAKGAADNSNTSLTELTGRAENVTRKLELMMASMHDIEARRPAPEPVFSHRSLREGQS